SSWMKSSARERPSFCLSAGSYDKHFKKAGQVRTLIINDFAKVFEKYDLILGPTTPTPAWDLGARVDDPISMYLADLLTIPVNLAGPGIDKIGLGALIGLS
ncbi:hypothetical protein FDX20_26775, partial [Citrobacter sp. TBCS-11]